ncbi:MAG TPA: hypothetical protein VMX94_08325 [Armatimonadota bacterium]|nr:hypothetical protein [Armatimonadota bacterium]
MGERPIRRGGNLKPETCNPKLWTPYVLTLILCALLVCAVVSLPALAEEDFVTLGGDSWRWYPDERLSITGSVQASYRDYQITADSVEADFQANSAVFKGRVQLTIKQDAVWGGQRTVEGEQLTLDLKTKEWHFEKASSRIELATLRGEPSGQAFVRSATLSGDENDLRIEAGSLTTCDLEHPHYYFNAKEIDVYPDSRIVAHGVSLVALDKRLFTVNSLVIPIRGLRQNFLPQIGSSVEEGMFLKTSYAYTATEKSQGFLKLDLMQRRGIGAGIEHSYNLSAASGLVSLYYLADREIGGNNITGRLQHQQKLGSIGLNLTSDYRTNNYLYYPATTTRNWQLDLSHAKPNASTVLAFRGNATSGFGEYQTRISSLRHTQQFSSRMSGMLSTDMRTYEFSGMTSPDRELDSVLELRQREDKYDLSLIASRRTDLDGDDYTGDDFYSSLDRLPELTYETDSYRSGMRLLGLPSRLAVSAGRYHEEPSGISEGRLLLQWDMLGQTFDLGSRNELSVNAGFRQAFYASDMAQHVLRLNGLLTTRFNDYMKGRLSYNYQRPEGYSPFRFDYTGKYNYLRAVMDYQDSEKLRWSLSSGYALDRDTYPWQDLALRLTAHPSSSYAFSVSTGYDLNRSKWRNLISHFQVSVPDRIGLDIGTRYDIERGKLGLARGRVDLRIGRKWRLEGITSWNGITKEFDYRSFRLTRDLHCWEASLVYNDETGFRSDRGLRLELRIKAFPGVDRFGIGQYGQAVDTSMGEYYY